MGWYTIESLFNSISVICTIYASLILTIKSYTICSSQDFIVMVYFTTPAVIFIHLTYWCSLPAHNSIFYFVWPNTGIHLSNPKIFEQQVKVTFHVYLPVVDLFWQAVSEALFLKCSTHCRDMRICSYGLVII